jgi:hypothetical protein
MALSYENNLDKCTIITTDGKEYKKLSDIPETEYVNIHTINNMNPKLIKSDKYFFKIKKLINIRFISCDFDKWNELVGEKITNKISHFEKLSILGIIDHNNYSLVLHNTGNFIWKNKMTIFNPSNSDLTNILDIVEYLNIINDTEYDYINIPNTIKYLHICINNINEYKQSNLPIGLQTITITIPEIYKRNCKKELYSIIKIKTKLPFECKLIIDDVFS